MIRIASLLTFTTMVVFASTLRAQLVIGNDVSAEVIDRILVLTGDEVGNRLTFRNNAAGLPTLQGNRGTTINGEPRFRLSNLEIDGIRMDMGEGDDVVIFRGVSLIGDGAVLTYDGGPGRDSLFARGGVNRSEFVGNVFVDGGAGLDRFDISDYFLNGNVRISGGTEDDRVKIVNTNVNEMMVISTDAGQGFVDIARMTTPLLSVIGSGGIDRINVDRVTIDPSSFGFGFPGFSESGLLIFGDGRRDLVSVTNVTSYGSPVDIDLGDGRDDAILESIVVLDSLNARPITLTAGAGNDRVFASRLENIALSDSLPTAPGLLDGGDGMNDFLMIELTDRQSVVDVNFEQVDDGSSL